MEKLSDLTKTCTSAQHNLQDTINKYIEHLAQQSSSGAQEPVNNSIVFELLIVPVVVL